MCAHDEHTMYPSGLNEFTAWKKKTLPSMETDTNTVPSGVKAAAVTTNFWSHPKNNSTSDHCCCLAAHAWHITRLFLIATDLLFPKLMLTETNRCHKRINLWKLWKKWQTECQSGKKPKCMIQDPLIMLTTSEQKYWANWRICGWEAAAYWACSLSHLVRLHCIDQTPMVLGLF